MTTMLDLALDLHAKALDLAGTLKFDKNHEVQRTLVSLYGTILEQSDSLIFLAQSRKLAGSDAILRSLLEAFVDFSALVKEEQYILNMRAAFHEEWIKLIERGIAGDNDFLAGFHENEGVTQQLENHRRLLAACKAAGGRYLANFQRFEKAGMVNEYRSIYRLIPHTAIPALERDDLDRDDEVSANLLRHFIVDADDRQFRRALAVEDPGYECHHSQTGAGRTACRRSSTAIATPSSACSDDSKTSAA